MPPRTPWAELPAPARAAVQQHTGPALDVTDIAGGLNCATAARLRTDNGAVFVKASPTGSQGARQQAHEASTGPWLPPTAPTVIAYVHAAGWSLIATAWIDGRHADLTPGSTDLAPIRDALTTARQPPPADAPLPALADVWGGHATPEEARHLTGEHLVHADLHDENILIADGRAWFIDWALSARGPAWVDTADMALRLVEDGHTAPDALAWAARIPAWRDADPEAVAAWVDVSCRHWEALNGARDARHGIARWQSLRPSTVP